MIMKHLRTVVKKQEISEEILPDTKIPKNLREFLKNNEKEQ